MAAGHVQPQTLEERLIYYTIAGSWVLYLVGGLYIASPVLGWSLVALGVARSLGLYPHDPGFEHRRRQPLPLGVLVWIASMLVMLLALIVGHMQYDLGFPATLKSSIGWMKGWALMAVFAFIGATMNIRPKVIYRASNVLGAQTLALAPIFLVAALLHLPRVLYVSPLQLVGGPGPEFFTVELYSVEPTTGAPRWRFFAPWAPAAAVIASMAFVFALFDHDRFWKTIGIVSALVVCLMSQSRMAIIAIPGVCLLMVVLSNLMQRRVYVFASLVPALLLPFVGAIMNAVEDATSAFSGARASSSRVRATLQRIALHRWQNEAPIWGHGTVERGPHVVEYMPIGSHHTWNGLLYVKGAVGFGALAVPMVWTFAELIAKAQTDRVARAGLAVLLLIAMFSFGENLEILVYLFWPAVIVIGVAMKRPFKAPWRPRLGAHMMA